jgi:adenosine deaminase
MEYRDYLRLVPKIELHCHVVAVLRPERLLTWARERGVALASTDPETLFDYDNIVDFLAVFNAAHDVFRTADDFAILAYEGVADAVADGNLRYREYYINPDNFAHLGIDYPTVIDGLIDGLRRAEAEFGVGFGIVPAVNRSYSLETALAFVETVAAHPRPEVIGIGQDDLRADGQESPLDWAPVFARAHELGLRVTAHVGELPSSDAASVIEAWDALGLDRVDHGYHVMDDDLRVAQALERGIRFTVTPRSTQFLSGWPLDEQHRIAGMIRAGLAVTIATDDQMFFRTTLREEYEHVGLGMGFGPETIEKIVLDAVDATWLAEGPKEALRADFRGQLRALRAALDA